MANQNSTLWERLGTDHDLSPPWTSLNIVKAIKSGLFLQPPAQRTIERNIAFQMVNDRLTFQEQSWIPNAPEDTQLVFIPARVDNCAVTAIIEEHKLFFNLCIVALMSIKNHNSILPGMYIGQVNQIHAMSIKAYAMP